MYLKPPVELYPNTCLGTVERSHADKGGTYKLHTEKALAPDLTGTQHPPTAANYCPQSNHNIYLQNNSKSRCLLHRTCNYRSWFAVKHGPTSELKLCAFWVSTKAKLAIGVGASLLNQFQA